MFPWVLHVLWTAAWVAVCRRRELCLQSDAVYRLARGARSAELCHRLVSQQVLQSSSRGTLQSNLVQMLTSRSFIGQDGHCPQCGRGAYCQNTVGRANMSYCIFCRTDDVTMTSIRRPGDPVVWNYNDPLEDHKVPEFTAISECVWPFPRRGRHTTVNPLHHLVT